MIDHHFSILQEIIWNKEASAGGSCAWGSWQSASNPSLRDVHEYIIVGVKTDSLKGMVFPLDEIDEWPKSIEGKKIDINMKEYFTNMWAFQTESAKRVNHPAPFPVELPLRLIKLFSKTGDVILDPFMGSGTVAIAALITKRHYVGFDINPEFILTAQTRIDNLRNNAINSTLDTFIDK